MILSFLRRRRPNDVIEDLYQRVARAARQPALFLELGFPDTAEGRFEALVLHVALIVRRLNALSAPAPDAGQDLVDVMFRELDRALRELGTSDLAVPKRMKALAGIFNDRMRRYAAAVDAGDETELRRLLAVRLGEPAERHAALAAYVRASAADLDGLDFDALLQRPDPFPPAVRFVERT
ncbi:ubiquinol-cytochrome C chaperone [Chelatococcus daeguensis]|uniref:Ubiquinol-cytochrome c chaperone domain-containing protein n=2 Tax=Chelatococcus TaxID=28209 RepID=A0AAC9JPK7_9HYPH|nr:MULTISPECIES: ubiquinol-cytochrome C chaperone family protein [Chelatococcus]APF37304.1 hypothetical protein BOQ54_08145 [Chelatococcus daeguensis]KZE35891.1 hypothetical protein AVW15_13255 [Chelatococcus daeguensis]MBM3085205.1 ubiquinol-cytochrome C chaperone [Chelatococcus daeguensis]CUA90139.1 Uncharacterized protein Ga0061061_11176 [Chelatococcus sambhunathii]